MSVASSKYVSLTTFRKSGVAVPSPVWIAPLGDGTAGFTTDLTSGKVKRIRNNPRVTLQACTMRGQVIAGSPIIEATAEVVTGEAVAPIHRAIRKKYKILGALIGVPDKVKGLFGKKSVDCGIIFTLPAD